MYKNRFVLVFTLLLALVFVTPSIAQDAKKGEAKKMEKKEMGSVKEVKCDPACGFCIQSKDEKEIVSVVKLHAKTHHQMVLTDAKVKEMIKDVK
ncbi:MAG: DUF1059 domain-containing protein [Ignavibacteriales bacterium]|nr:MAG: DUF1059 domain-containing protein [Ignavibacteriales bacterium]